MSTAQAPKNTSDLFTGGWLAGTFAVLISALGSVQPALASGRDQREISLGLIAGVPSLAGLQFKYLGIKRFELGLGYGTLPINSLLQSRVSFEAVPMDLGLADPYAVYPSSTFRLTGFHLFGRYFPGDSGFFGQLAYEVVRFQATFSGTLKNETSGATSSNFVSGTVSLNQPMVTPALGYQFFIHSGLHVDLLLGVGVLTSSRVDVTYGGTASSILPILPSDQEPEVDQAKDEVKQQVEDAVVEYRNKVKFFPSFEIGISYAF